MAWIQTRRDFLGCTAGLLAGAASRSWGAADSPHPKIAIVLTACFLPVACACAAREFSGAVSLLRGAKAAAVDVVALYAAQFNKDDMLRRIAKDYSLPIHGSITEALCRGGDQLAVDGVVSIGEHGNYPENELGQQMYPRKEFFDEIVGVFRKSGRSVPVFNDKHLSYRFDWAKEMVDVSRELKFPFLAGSSVPLAQRVPDVSLPPGLSLMRLSRFTADQPSGMDTTRSRCCRRLPRGGPAVNRGFSRVTYLTAEELRGDKDAAGGLRNWPLRR